ncbi:MAG: 30S ribosomal protein S20 [Candidatus Colwellbacteria bacterium]|nr:30S ribosomal protein S20 [Candidatus Colwellbacteria bacterium]
MPRIKSAKKALRQSARKRERNVSQMRVLKTTIKQYRKAIEAGNVEEAKSALPKVYKTIDKAAKTNLIKENKANRTKSRLTHLVAKATKASV